MRGFVAACTSLFLLASAAGADDFGIDFSPLQDPGFGHMRDEYRVVPEYDGLSGADPLPPQPPQQSPEMADVASSIAAGGVRLSQDIIRLPDPPGVSGGTELVSVTGKVGPALVSSASDSYVSLMAPTGYSPPETVAARSLPLAASIMSGTRVRGISDEDAAFLAGQAAMALEGAPLQLQIYDTGGTGSAEQAAQVHQALSDVARALERVNNIRAERREIESRWLKLGPSYTWQPEDFKTADDRKRVITEEKAVVNALAKAQKKLVTVLLPSGAQ